jgi:hypothetical protein
MKRKPWFESRPRIRWSALLLALAFMVAAPLKTAMPETPRPAPLTQPTEAQLGAPVYPGAIYQAQVSGGMSQGESYYWVFVTADPASKVAAFYKARTGVTPTEMEGMYMFVFRKGANPYMPDHGLVIEPNKQLTAGPPRTAVTFNRKK